MGGEQKRRKRARYGATNPIATTLPPNATALVADPATILKTQASLPKRTKTLPSRYRDQLTGAPLERGAHLGGYILWRDDDETRPQAAREPIPLSLHRNVTEDSAAEPGFEAGHERKNAPQGCVYSGALQGYLRGVLPRSVAEEQRRWIRWWDVSYVLGRMYASMGKPAVEAVLAVERDGRGVTEVAEEFKHSSAWVCRMIALSRKRAAGYYRYGRAERLRRA